MHSHILLDNADAVGTETLKNLVLPGVGKFTILDNKLVTSQDASSNFFLPEQEIGKSRADVARDALCEMNPDVLGFSLVSQLDIELEKDSSFLKNFSLVILANPSLPHQNLASAACWRASVPLVIVKSYGFIGECLLQLKEHAIVESKPDPEILYLRLNDPFDSLLHFYNSFHFSNQTPHEFSHTPYVVILHHYLQQWAAQHDGKKPKSESEKKEFKALLKNVGTPVETSEDGSVKPSYLRENYEEAIKNLNRFLEPVRLPSHLVELFGDESLLNVNTTSRFSDFKVLLVALKLYIEGPGGGVHWPLSGVVPDMTASSDVFMALQQLFLARAEQDRRAFADIVERVLVQANRGAEEISDEVIQIFCRNVMNLRFFSQQHPVQERYSNPKKELVEEFLSCDTYWDDPLQTPLLYHYVLLAAEEFHHVEGRYPGCLPSVSEVEGLAADSAAVWKILKEVAARHGVPCEEDEATCVDGGAPRLTFAHAQEVTRYGGAELHNISSLVGGVASQECVKVMTQLFVPMNNCYIYNGIAGCSNTFEL